MSRNCLTLVLLVSLCSQLTAGELWPWPFAQPKMEVGVDFVERVVETPTAAVRTWRMIGVDRKYADREGRLIRVSEKQIHLLVAGSSKPLITFKAGLDIRDAIYVQNFEIRLAQSMDEPGAEKLREVTEADLTKTATGESRKDRVWHFKSGREPVYGEYFSYDDPDLKTMLVTVRTVSGQSERIKIPADSLVPADRAFAMQLIAAEKKKVDEYERRQLLKAIGK